MSELSKEDGPDLTALIELFKAGALTADEFKAEKDRLGAPDELLPEKPDAPEVDPLAGCLRPFLWFLGFCAIVFAYFFISDVVKGDDPPAPPTSWEVRSHCENWVADKLKSPATAKFSDQDVSNKGSNTWVVTGAVDSENGFGALVRTAWTCDIQLDGETFRGEVNF